MGNKQYSNEYEIGGAIENASPNTEFPDEPNNAPGWSARGRSFAAEGNYSEAIRCFKRAVALDRAYADGWHNLGLALKQRRVVDKSFEALQTALNINPTRCDTWLVLGNLLSDVGQSDDATGCFERAMKYDDGSQGAFVRLGRELASLGEVEQALSLLQDATGKHPENIEGLLALADTLETAGKAPDALSVYNTILACAPKQPMAVSRALSLWPKESDEEDLVHEANQILDSQQGSHEDRALVAYGLAKFHDRRGQVADAAASAKRANANRARGSGKLDRSRLKARIDGIIETYTERFFSERRDYGSNAEQPVFIVGLPRSGTTLTEQILSSHSKMDGAGELPDLARLAAQQCVNAGEKPWMASQKIDKTLSAELAQVYLTRLLKGTTQQSLRISDKSPLNFFHLAFAALLFPKARVIHCTRDIRDNGLSIWMENFSLDQTWSTDLVDIAFFAEQYQRLMAHWRRVLPLPILEVGYEDTVEDLETQSRRLTDFLDAEWEENCLSFHKSERAVQTPSRWQVRQPLYTSSKDKWRRYESYIGPLIHATERET